MVITNTAKQILLVLSGAEGPEEIARVKQFLGSDLFATSWIAPKSFKLAFPGNGLRVTPPLFFSSGILFWIYYLAAINFFVFKHLIRQRSSRLVLFHPFLCLALFPTILVLRNPCYIFLMRLPWARQELRAGKWVVDCFRYLINCLGLLAAEKIVITTSQLRSAILKEASFLGGRLAVLPLSLCDRDGAAEGASSAERSRSQAENQLIKTARFYERRERISEDKMTLIEEFSFLEKSFIVTTFSEFLNLEVVGRLLNALADCGEERLCLVIVGKGPEKSNAQALALGLGLEQRVVFLAGDFIPDRILQGSDLYLSISQSIVMSDNLMKGLGFGVSLVAIDNLQSRELLEFEELLVKNDAEMISQRLITLQRNREALRLVKARCETISKKYDFNWAERASELVST